MGHVVSFGVAFLVALGIALVGERYGARAEKAAERVLYVVIGAFVGLVLVGLIWTTIASF